MQVPSETGQFGNLNDAVRHAGMLRRQGLEVRRAIGEASKLRSGSVLSTKKSIVHCLLLAEKQNQKRNRILNR